MVPSAKSHAGPRSPRRVSKWTLRLLIVLPFAAFLAFRGCLSLDINRLENRARERNEPLTIREINAALPEMPDEENAALAIIELWKQDDGQWDWEDYDDVPGIGSTINDRLPWKGKELAAARLFQATFEDFYLEMRKAVELPQSRIPLENTEESLELSDYWLRLKSSVRATLMLSLMAAQEDREDDALYHFETGVRQINTLRNEPDLMSQLFRLNSVNTVCRGLADLVGYRHFSGSSLDQFEELAISLRSDDGFRKAVVNLRADNLATYSLPAHELGTLDIWPERIRRSPFLQEVTLGGMRLSGWLALDRRQTLKMFDEALTLTNNTAEDFQKMQELTELNRISMDRFPPSLIFREQFLPLDRVLQKFHEAEASIRLATIAIALERYRLSNGGALPDSLSELTRFGLKKIPLDPFDGEPLRYIKKANGYWVYSVHADGLDDKGETYKVADERDYTMRVEWPPLKSDRDP